MKEAAKADEPPEDKHSYSPLGILGWIFAAFVVYVPSIGPVTLTVDKGYVGDRVFEFYGPLVWLYEDTFMHKTLGLYLHLWDPQRFDKNGDLKP